MPPDRSQATNGIDRDSIQERQLARLVARVCNRKNAVLELDETGETLCVWYWCISQLQWKQLSCSVLPIFEYRPVSDEGERVVPSDLVAHRNSHQFRGPYCLCGFIDDRDPPGHYEAAIVMLKRGPNVGEYVACCALSKCGYVGKSAQLQLVDQELN